MTGRRRHRRVIAMSQADRERAARGEDVFAPRVRAPQDTQDADAGASDGANGAGAPAREADILREVPPHWFGGRGS